MTPLLWRAQKCWVTDVSIQVFCISSGISRHLRCSTIVFQCTFLDPDSSQCTAWYFIPVTVHQHQNVHCALFTMQNTGVIVLHCVQYYCTAIDPPWYFALSTLHYKLCTMQYTVYSIIAQCKTPGLVFRANHRTIMPSLLDPRQLRLSTTCLCKCSMHLLKM